MHPERGPEAARPPTRRGSFEAAGHAAFPFGGADVWRILVTWDGVPCAYPVVADPGAISDPQLSDAVLRRCAVEARRRGLHVAELAERMGLSGPAHERPSCTVVLCTRRRPHLAARALKAIGALDPPADEVIVVDNDPGDLDCREAAAAAGARYVVERRRGLNWARAAGLAAASCDLVAFTDDDVVVSPAWLAPLGRVFGDPGVGAATGVSVGLTLDTEAQVLRESIAGLIPDLLPGRFDWTNLAPTSGGRAGAGANMVFRRDLLLRLGDVFPPDLEVGTRAGSGGDLYVLFRVLAAGRRIALEPALYAEHEHHPDFENLHSTVASYGMGFSAFLTKVAVEHKEPLALTTWWWLVERWARALVVALTTGSRTELAVRGAYLRGGVRGAAGWARARRDQRGRARRRPLGPSSQHLEPPSGLSLVVEDSPEARNRAALAAQGDVVLFLARGVRASPETAARHLARHRSLDRPAVVVGRTEPDALASGLAAQVEALGRFALLRDRRWAGSLTHAYVTGENLSIPRELFERLGGFDTTMSFDGAARELALRALKAGARIEYEHAAAADQGLSFGTAHALERAAQAGRDDARIAQLHPVAGVPSAPALAKRGIVPPAPALLVANALERGRMRRSWLGVYRRLAGTAYRTGLGASGRAAEPPFEIDLDGADPVEIPPPAVAAVSLRISDDVVGAVRPPGGRWSIGFAEAAIAALGDGPERELARARHPWRPSDATGLDGVLVLSGPHGTDDAAEAGLVAAGARVEPVSGPGEEFWDAVARRVASAPEPIVAVLLGGARADVRWLGSAVVPLRGPDVAAVVGTGVRDLAMPAPALLLSRHLAQGLYAPVGRAPQFLVLSTKKAAELGGLAACTAVFGEHGPVLDVLHRALDAGMVVAYQQTPGIAPPGTEFPASWRLELERSIARGGLLARAAIDRGPLAGIGLLAARLVIRPAATMWPALRYGWPPPRLVLGTAAGEVLGCIRTLGSPGRARRAAQPGT